MHGYTNYIANTDIASSERAIATAFSGSYYGTDQFYKDLFLKGWREFRNLIIIANIYCS